MPQRLEVMSRQGVDGALLFPTLGVLLQRPLRSDVDALHATFHAFNQWLLEDWGFAAPLYGVPMIILSDPQLAGPRSSGRWSRVRVSSA